MPETSLSNCRFSLLPSSYLDFWSFTSSEFHPLSKLNIHFLQPLSQNKCFLITILSLTLCFLGVMLMGCTYSFCLWLLYFLVPPPPEPFCLHHPDTSWNLGQTYDTQDLINPKCWICRQISHAGQCVELHNSTCHVVLLAPFLAGTIPLPGNNHNQKHQILQHPGKPLELFHASEKDIKCQSWLQLLVEQEN